MTIKIGTGPDSWGVFSATDPDQVPWEQYLDEIAEAGYEWTELGPYGYLPTDLSVLRQELKERGLRVAGAFAMGHLEDPEAWPELEKQILGATESVASLGGKFLVLIDGVYTNMITGEMMRSARLEDEEWKRLIDTTHKIARIVVERFGLGLVFHPHCETHIQYEEQIEAFLEQTDPGLVSLCLDTGHHAYSGGDPVAFMRRHHQRIPYLHLKSVDDELQKQVEKENIPFTTAVGMGVFCEPSRGAVDFLAFRDVLRDINYEGWAIVEQDMYPVKSFEQPLPIAKRTREYLQEIGIG